MAKTQSNKGTRTGKTVATQTTKAAGTTKAAPQAAATKAPRPAPNLAIKVLPWPTAVVQPRANTKRAAWVAAVLGARTVAQALAAPLPAGVPPLGMGQVNWCAKHKLVALLPGSMAAKA